MNVIQRQQSFKLGEITPEEANQVGYETAMRWTKGKERFIRLRSLGDEYFEECTS